MSEGGAVGGEELPAAGAGPTEEVPEEEEDATDIVGEKKTVQELLEADKEDDSLRRYKESLLGSAAAAADASGDARHVIVQEIAILADGKEITAPLSTSEDVANLAARRLAFKEGAEYRTRLRFVVQKNIVTGLKFSLKVYKLGIRVDNSLFMIGSYPPKPGETVEYVTPPAVWPSGFMARGNYSATVRVFDDDKEEHLTFKYSFAIAKDWPAEA